jgi:hypothetical protein
LLNRTDFDVLHWYLEVRGQYFITKLKDVDITLLDEWFVDLHFYDDLVIEYLTRNNILPYPFIHGLFSSRVDCYKAMDDEPSKRDFYLYVIGGIRFRRFVNICPTQPYPTQMYPVF